MSETAAEPAAPAAEPEAADQVNPDEAALGDAGKNAIERMKGERNEAKREAAELAARLKEIEDSQKSEAEKLAERQAELERSSAANAAKALRYEVAEKAGLPLSAAGRLQGNTEEELLADADALKALIGGSLAAARPTPKPDLTQGGSGDTPNDSSDWLRAQFAN